MMLCIDDAKEARAKLLEDARALIEAADTEKRDMTEDEQNKFDALHDESDKIKADIERRNRHERLRADVESDGQIATPRTCAPVGEAPPKTAEWRNYRDGTEVRVLAPVERFSDLHTGERLSLGRAVRSMIVGDWRGAEREQRAMSTTNNVSAGYLVPDPLAATVIDLARAKSVLVQAGAQTVDMTASDMRIARVTDDAAMEVKGENSAFTGDDVEFDSIVLTSHTIGTVVKMSRELAADAPNAVALIEDTIARALAAKLDWYGLRGTGSAMPLGLINMPDVNTEAVGGSLDFDNLLNALSECEVDNHTPNAYVLSPANVNVLRQLKSGDGTNSAALYLAPPTAVTNLTQFVTSAMPDDTAVLGDFSQFIIGLRQSPTIEVSTEAGDAFEKHMVFVKITWRGDFHTAWRPAFCTLTGIS